MDSKAPNEYSFEATLHREWIDDIEPTLKTHWRIGASEYDFQVEREITNNNAEWKCTICGESAGYDLLQRGVFEGSRCSNHHPANIEELGLV